MVASTLLEGIRQERTDMVLQSCWLSLWLFWTILDGSPRQKAQDLFRSCFIEGLFNMLSHSSCSIDKTKLCLAKLPVRVLRDCSIRPCSLRVFPSDQRLRHISYTLVAMLQKYHAWRAVNNPPHVQLLCLEKKKKT